VPVITFVEPWARREAEIQQRASRARAWKRSLERVDDIVPPWEVTT
jgi:hypothetical protein